MLFFHHPRPVVDRRPVAELTVRCPQPAPAATLTLREREREPPPAVRPAAGSAGP